MKFSIVSSLYQSADTVEEFVGRADSAASALDADYEIILVNDGSTDDTLARALGLVDTHDCLTVINLSRNFGHHKALFAGMKQARGDFVFVLDSDLEERPEWLSVLYAHMEQHGADVVYAVQAKRKGGWIERVLGSLFYKMFNRITDFRIPEDAMVARLMSGRFVRTLTAYPESTDYLPGLFAYSGFKQLSVKLDKQSKGSSAYTFKRRAELAMNAFIRFSYAPLRLILTAGLGLCLLAALMGLYQGVRHTVGVANADGVMLLLTAVIGIGGLILTSLGIMSLYIMRIFDEVRRRPDVIIESIHPQGDDE